jgi:hypothetical protein
MGRRTQHTVKPDGVRHQRLLSMGGASKTYSVSTFTQGVLIGLFSRGALAPSQPLAAEAAAGVRHHVALSIVGTDRMPGCPTMATSAPLTGKSLILQPRYAQGSHPLARAGWQVLGTSRRHSD